MDLCYNLVLIYAEFKIINMFFKDRRSKYKPAYVFNTQNVLNCSCLHRDFSLVMEIWFKVMEKSWKSIGQIVYEPFICLWMLGHPDSHIPPTQTRGITNIWA